MSNNRVPSVLLLFGDECCQSGKEGDRIEGCPLVACSKTAMVSPDQKGLVVPTEDGGGGERTWRHPPSMGTSIQDRGDGHDAGAKILNGVVTVRIGFYGRLIHVANTEVLSVEIDHYLLPHSHWSLRLHR